MEAPDGDRKEVRRPMNAFLIFCKRHRTMVREKNPHLDNRSVTRILGDLWANLQEEEKSQYTDLAKQYKDAFMKANPDYKWHNPDRLTHGPTGKPLTRPSNIRLGRDESDLPLEGTIIPGKLADPSNMGGLSNLLVDKPAYGDGHKQTSAKSAAATGAPQSTVTSLMDLAMMCSSELTEDQMMSGHARNLVVPGNKILDLTSREENCIEMEDVKNLNGSEVSSESVKGCNNNGDSRVGLVSSGDKLLGRCEEGGYSSNSGQMKEEDVLDKLHPDTSVQSKPREITRKLDTETIKAEVTGHLPSNPADMIGLSATKPKVLSSGPQHIPDFASFLMNKSNKYNMNDEMVRGENYSGRKRCYSETSVDIYADHRKLHRMLKENGGNDDQSASLDMELGEGEMMEDGAHPVRKSKRRNRGQRYQELINEGIIQPSKERMAVIKGETESSRNEQDSSEEEVVPRPMGDLGFDVLSVYPRQIRKRTCSESEKTRSLQEDMQRYKTGDFDLEAHIATLPACSLEKVQRNSKRPAGKVRSMSESCGRSPVIIETTAPAPAVVPVPEVVLTVPPHLKQNKQTEPVTGSQRRKARKHSVTHLQLVRPEKAKVEVSNSVKKAEACPIKADAADKPSPNSNCDPQLDVIKSEKSETNDQTVISSTDGSQKSAEVSENINIVHGNTLNSQKSAEVSENTNTVQGNSLSACNMIDNILVSLVDQKEAASDGKVTSKCESVRTDENSNGSSLHKSSLVSTPVSSDSGVISLELPTTGSEKTAVSHSQPFSSTDLLPSSTKFDSSGLSNSSDGFTSLKTPTAETREQKSLCILSTEANTSTPITSVVSTDCDNSQTKRINSPHIDNTSSEEKAIDLQKDNGDVQSVSITMATTSAAGGAFISEVPCVSGQEYKVTPPQQVAVVNS